MKHVYYSQKPINPAKIHVVHLDNKTKISDSLLKSFLLEGLIAYNKSKLHISKYSYNECNLHICCNVKRGVRNRGVAYIHSRNIKLVIRKGKDIDWETMAKIYWHELEHLDGRDHKNMCKWWGNWYDTSWLIRV